MRTIKFRGKRADNGEWVYGYLHLPIGGDNLMIQVSNTDSYGVIPDTVGQFSGFKDKDGKEIYEGDIVLKRARDVEKERILEVIYMGAGFSLGIWYPLSWNADRVEVIGNIHDNPELLKTM